METVAVYWEPIICTYGFDVRSGLTLATWERRAGLDGDETGLGEPDVAGVDLVMAVGGRPASGGLVLTMVLDGDLAQQDAHPISATVVERIHPVDVVHFQGPHFGDRYGIATAALSAMAQGGVELLLLGCTGASVYLTVPGGEGARAVRSLRQAFTTPGATPPPGSAGP